MTYDVILSSGILHKIPGLPVLYAYFISEAPVCEILKDSTSFSLCIPENKIKHTARFM